MASVKLYLDTRKAKTEAPMTLAVSHKGRTALLQTGVRLAADQWDGTNVVRHRHKGELNEILQDKLYEARKTIMSIKSADGLTATEIRDRIAGAGESGSLWRYYKRHMNDPRYSKGTKAVYDTVFRSMERFDPQIKAKAFEDIDKAWLESFDIFLSKTQTVNSRSVTFRSLKAVFNAAIDDGITEAYPFRRFKIRREETRKRSLSLEDLRRLRDWPCEPRQREHVDMFLLMVYLSGIESVDLFNLRPRDIVDGRLEYKRAKTHRLLSVRIEPEARAIINKYRGEEWLLSPHDRYSDHKDWLHHMNHALKAVGRPLGKRGKAVGSGLFPDLSSKWAKHTVATLAASLDIPRDTISLILGHSSGNPVTRIYIKEDMAKADKAMRAVIDLING